MKLYQSRASLQRNQQINIRQTQIARLYEQKKSQKYTRIYTLSRESYVCGMLNELRLVLQRVHSENSVHYMQYLMLVTVNIRGVVCMCLYNVE